jgi:tol-pal system protein YbgF
MFKSGLAALLFTTALIAAPAQAQSRKELAAQNVQLAERISVLESRLLTGDPAAERLMARIDSLEIAQRNLTGELERLRYERDTLKSEVEALTGDIRAMQALSDRMKIHLDAVDLVAKEQQSRSAPITYGPATSAQPSVVPGAPVLKEQELVINPDASAPYINEPQAPVGNDVSQLGELGKTKLAEGDFVGAQTALSQYLQFNPDAADAGEMNFWLGESYYVRGGYADAADAFIASMRTDPKGVKAPDAMVRLAATLRQLGNTTEACQTLAAFPAQYPQASDTVKEKARIEAARTGC